MTSGNLTADFIQGLLQFIGKLLFDAIIKWKKMGDIKAELALSFENSLNETMTAYNDFLYAYFACYGAIINARQIHFLEPETRADELVQRLDKKYTTFLTKFKGLMNLIKVHELSVKEVLGKDWIIIEIYLGAFKEKEPDWDFLFNNQKIQDAMRFQENEEFYNQLTLKLNLFSKKIKTPKFAENLYDFSAVYKSRNFFNCILRCIHRSVRLVKIRN